MIAFTDSKDIIDEYIDSYQPREKWVVTKIKGKEGQAIYDEFIMKWIERDPHSHKLNTLENIIFIDEMDEERKMFIMNTVRSLGRIYDMNQRKKEKKMIMSTIVIMMKMIKEGDSSLHTSAMEPIQNEYEENLKQFKRRLYDNK